MLWDQDDEKLILLLLDTGTHSDLFLQMKNRRLSHSGSRLFK